MLAISQVVEYRYPERECLTVLVDITDRSRIAALQHDVQHDPHTEAMARLKRERELRQALKCEDQLLLYFQPIVALADGRIQELAALVRWQYACHGLLYPEDFIGMAEETGLMEPLGEWVLQRACEQLQGFEELLIRQSGQATIHCQ